MKHLTALLLAMILSFSALVGVSAQAAETIWMETSQQSYAAGETITVTIKANTATPIQGFSFQLQYDPACLQPEPPTSLLSGLNYMSVPQSAGLVDAIFASTTPLNVNGALAEVRFKALAACQTNLILGNAFLAILDASSMAVHLPGINLGTSNLALGVGGAQASALQPTKLPETNPTSAVETNPTVVPDIDPTSTDQPISFESFKWLLLPLFILLGLIFVVAVIIALVFLLRGSKQPIVQSPAPMHKTPALFIKRGPQAGTILPLVRFPCRIGSDPENEICLSDSRISPAHAEIFADQYGYSLVDLGSQDGTYLNGKLIRDQQVPLKLDDALRLGGVLLVFGQV